jgi:hypothetical protein
MYDPMACGNLAFCVCDMALHPSSYQVHVPTDEIAAIHIMNSTCYGPLFSKSKAIAGFANI